MTSLSRTLLKRVLSIYFALTFLVTLIQVVAEFYSARDVIQTDMQHTLESLQQGLAQAVWEINPEQESALIDGLIQLPSVVGVEVYHFDDETRIRRGVTPERTTQLANSQQQTHSFRASGRLFGLEMPLVYGSPGASLTVGRVAIYSSDQVAFERIKVSLIFLIFNAMLKTALLIFMFLWVFRRLLSKPLTSFARQIGGMDLHNMNKIHIHQEKENELTLLSATFNRLVDKLMENRRELDRHNTTLAEEVEKSTFALQESLNEMEVREAFLAKEVELRLQAEQELKASYRALKQSQGELDRAQDQLVASQKLNELGQMVAEVTHELNTPIGIAITSSSYLENKMKELDKLFKDRKITIRLMEQYLAGGMESAELIRMNMQRAAELISDFKLIAVDEASDRLRTVNLREYVDSIVRSLHHKHKRTEHRIDVDCDRDIVLYCRPGAIAQIFTNLIMNSLVHGFEAMDNGVISITARKESGVVSLIYEDNGKGLSEEQLEKLFDPFYTTRPSEGGSGLGAHIVRKLVTEDLQGSIEAESLPGEGLRYRMMIPIRSEEASTPP
ncbi:ATP-binding protein [Aestuariirhabdus sp. Z084]|uniref:ATP-binding protein n=1 Tax=Aestuariirhabdus haliotis TaxID=2918751 RepID=UPI00201B3AA3|nr:ATP-binding protein [Aestuariirhabdus haliotis]MCL6415048.1 ATP-binding protein [Aestuariirhabdus haliotis]MCL6418980.1 ATP-binding protein [Aestuariirhabdus haliotis]